MPAAGSHSGDMEPSGEQVSRRWRRDGQQVQFQSVWRRPVSERLRQVWRWQSGECVDKRHDAWLYLQRQRQQGIESVTPDQRPLQCLLRGRRSPDKDGHVLDVGAGWRTPDLHYARAGTGQWLACRVHIQQRDADLAHPIRRTDPDDRSVEPGSRDFCAGPMALQAPDDERRASFRLGARVGAGDLDWRRTAGPGAQLRSRERCAELEGREPSNRDRVERVRRRQDRRQRRHQPVRSISDDGDRQSIRSGERVGQQRHAFVDRHEPQLPARLQSDGPHPEW